MLADHRRQFKTVHFRHGNVEKNQRDLVFQQMIHRLARRCRLDQIFTKPAKDGLIGEQL